MKFSDQCVKCQLKRPHNKTDPSILHKGTILGSFFSKLIHQDSSLCCWGDT